jgi:purine-binding chemotaxis protein CheW
MNRLNRLVSFNLDDQKFALFLAAVMRIIRVVEITGLPEAPAIVLGIINIHGEIIPVFDIRKRFSLPRREMQLDDQLIIAHTSRGTVALLVDSVNDVFEVSEEKVVAGESILPGLDYIEGVVKTKDGMILIHDLEEFLSLAEEKALNEAIKGLNTHARKD